MFYGVAKTALVAVIVGVAGRAGPAAAALKLDMPAPISVPPLPAGAKAQAVSLTRIGANIAPGTVWLEEGPAINIPPCGGFTDTWKESNNRIALATFERTFGEQMKAVGLNSGRDATNLFEEQTASDLQVGALITGLSVKGCIHAVLKATLQGSATMDVEWQVYSVSQGKVVARIATHGGFSAGGLELGNVTPVVTGVFADTVRRLAANAQFRELITAPTAVAVAPKSVMLFTPATGSVRIADAAKGVVVIYAGDGQGSGILISPDGYILTNHHVAGGSGRVRVRWSDGTESIGEVLRSDPRRDVALIRTSGKSTALSIRHEPPVLGETVFAIGTPLEKEFQNTLTRGVVSGNRTIEGQPFIQSDVAVDHGNSGGPLLDEQGRVLALTDWGYAPDGVSHNLNFFIPIDDALRALGLSPAAEPPPQKAAAR